MPLEEELKLTVYRSKLEQEGSIDTVFPDSTPLPDVILYIKDVVEGLGILARYAMKGTLALGRLMDMASKCPPQDWEGTGYANFTDFQKNALGSLASNGTRFNAMAIYRAFGGVPIEQLEECSMDNLKQAATIVNHGVSDTQKERLLEMARAPRQVFQQQVEESGMLAPGEAFSSLWTISGSAGKIQELKDWANRQDIERSFPTGYVDALLAATQAYDGNGPDAMEALHILTDIIAAIEGSEDNRLPVELIERTQIWMASRNQMPAGAVIDGEYEHAPNSNE